jgi:serine/threonine protein phosphatase PrpC
MQADAPESFLASWLRPQAKGSTQVSEMVSLGTRAGPTRTENQDRVVYTRARYDGFGQADLAVLCDGIGGMPDGARCAETAMASFVMSALAEMAFGMAPRSVLLAAAQKANRRVHDRHGGRGGTTLAALLVHGRTAYACTVGDSRLFGVRLDGSLQQLSTDDTVGGALEAIGRRADEAVPEHDRLVQFVGMGPDLAPRVLSIEDAEVYRFFLLSSDGAYKIPAGILSTIARVATTPKQLVDRVLHVSEWLGGTDDATAVVLAAGLAAFPRGGEGSDDVARLWGPTQSLALWKQPASQRDVTADSSRTLTGKPPNVKEPRGSKKWRKGKAQQRLPVPAEASPELVINIGPPASPLTPSGQPIDNRTDETRDQHPQSDGPGPHHD